MINIVDAHWLKENLDNENLVLIDCRFSLMDKNYGKNSFNKRHIKGAVRVDIETELSGPVTKHGGRHPLPNIESLKDTFENIGINNDSIVVAYDDGDLAGASRLWWILKYLGHDKAYVLNGGINLFESVCGPVTNEIILPKKSNFNISLKEDMVVDMEYVKERLHDKNIALIDCREYRRYTGEFEPIDIKAGHIPNAINFFWKNILNEKYGNNEIKSIDDLKLSFKEFDKYDEIIIYCGSGITASPVSLVLNELNIPHKFYLGGFSDWISYKENLVDTI